MQVQGKALIIQVDILHVSEFTRMAAQDRPYMAQLLSQETRVLGYESDQCRCDTGKEALRHALLDCLDEGERREILREF